MSRLIFNGHDLSELFDVGEPEITILDATPDLREVPGRDGSVFAGSRLGVSVVSFQIAVSGEAAARRNALSTLGLWLAVDEPKPLVLPDTPDWYYMAIPNDGLALKRAIGAEVSTVSFTLVDPIAYGREVSITVPSSGSVTFRVDGTYKAKPTITASAAVRSGTSLVWGLLLDNGDHLRVTTGSSSSRAITLDCANRVCTLAGAVVLPTLTSDWFELEPGVHTIQNDQGSGSCTVKYRERWM